MVQQANEALAQAQSLRSATVYHIAPGGREPGGWVVATGTPEKPEPAVSTGYATKEAAQAEADRLNALAAAFEAGHDERRDEVLGRMLNSKATLL